MTRLAAQEIDALDPYKFNATIGKRVIHPGGRASTEALFARARFAKGAQVLDIGGGVATTAIEIARRFDARMAIMTRVLSRPANVRKMVWLMPRMAKAVPYLGYIVVSARKPS